MNERTLDPVWDAKLSPEEFDRRERELRLPERAAEHAEMDAMIAWFCRRYPTPLDRLRYVRRQMESITRTQAGIRAAR